MPQVGFKPTIAVSERTKTVHALNCMAIMMGELFLMQLIYLFYATVPAFQTHFFLNLIKKDKVVSVLNYLSTMP
jgi:hypothetical protein